MCGSPLYLLDSPWVTLYCLYAQYNLWAFPTDCTPPSTALIVLRPEKGPGYSEVLWESQAEPECELDKRERKRINFLLRLGSLGEGAVFELSLPVCPLPFPKHTTHAHAQTRARTHSSSIPRSSLSVLQPPLHDLHLATLLSRGVWRDANLVQDRVIALGTYPANPLWPPASTPPPPPPPPV